MNTILSDAITLAGIKCEGPYLSTGHLRDQSGVYVILGRNSSNWEIVLDVGESQAVRSRVENHDRKSQWKAQGYKQLGVAVIYVPNQQDRLRIEQHLRTQFNPPCGSR